MDALLIRARSEECRGRVESALRRSGHDHPVTVVAVTKTRPPALLAAAREAGLTEVGENRVPELEDKVRALGRDAVTWHLIGHLQRNKARRAAAHFDLLHSLDSPRLAAMLAEEGTERGHPVRALVQLNAGGEAAKGGFALDGALDAIAPLCELAGLRVEGVMTMAPFTDDDALLRRTFRTARGVWEEAGRQVPGFHPIHLSMGMSNDFEVAVEEGSTMVRLGTVLFGERHG
jgi:pyridoxal phosphate enzyme (YggS family)